MPFTSPLTAGEREQYSSAGGGDGWVDLGTIDRFDHHQWITSSTSTSSWSIDTLSAQDSWSSYTVSLRSPAYPSYTYSTTSTSSSSYFPVYDPYTDERYYAPVMTWSGGGGGNATDEDIRNAILVENMDQATSRAEVSPEEMTARQQRAELRRAELQQQRIEEESRRVVAQSRALDLLTQMLTPEQQESYRKNGYFEVLGSHGGRYRITQGTMGNILWIDPQGQERGTLCAHPSMREPLPMADVHLAQMLALTTDERSFINVANVHRGQRPDHLRLVRGAA